MRFRFLGQRGTVLDIGGHGPSGTAMAGTGTRHRHRAPAPRQSAAQRALTAWHRAPVSSGSTCTVLDQARSRTTSIVAGKAAPGASASTTRTVALNGFRDRPTTRRRHEYRPGHRRPRIDARSRRGSTIQNNTSRRAACRSAATALRVRAPVHVALDRRLVHRLHGHNNPAGESLSVGDEAATANLTARRRQHG